jgi:hypothetical protein
MALIEYGPIVLDANGSIGGTTFSATLAGRIAKSKSTMCNAGTAAELAARITLDVVTKAWAQLTKSQQGQWTAAGQVHPRPNRLGRYRPISGFALWTELGVNLLNAGQGLIDTPPTVWHVATVDSVNIQATQAPIATTQLAAAWSQQAMIDSQVIIKAGPPTPWGQKPTSHCLRTIATIVPNVNTPQLVGAAYAATYGLLPLSTPYQILFTFTAVNTSTGVAASPLGFVLSISAPAPTPPPTPGTSSSSATSIDESLNLYYTGDTANPAWLTLNLTPGIEYTIVWTSSNLTGAPTLQMGPSPTSLTTVRTFTDQDAYTFTADTVNAYYATSNAWTAGSNWTVTFAPTQVTDPTPPLLTTTSHRVLLLAEGTNARLVADNWY